MSIIYSFYNFFFSNIHYNFSAISGCQSCKGSSKTTTTNNCYFIVQFISSNNLVYNTKKYEMIIISFLKKIKR